MDEERFSQLLDQALDGLTDVVLAAVDAEPGLATRATVDTGYTLLHNACSGGHDDLARGLLDRKANVHQRDNDGWDPLIWSSEDDDRLSILGLLISRGADVNARDNAGRTALAWAALWDNLPACLYLISQCADLLSVNNGGQSVLEGYGYKKRIGKRLKRQRCKILRKTYDEGPHPNARWVRRWPFVCVLVCCDFQPLAARKAFLLMINPPLPPDAAIPPVPIGTPELYRAYLHGIVFSHPGFWKLIASYL